MNQADLDELEDEFFSAAEAGDLEVMRSMLARTKGEIAKNANSSGTTALHMVTLKGYEDMVQLLVKARADINAQTKETKKTALMLAATYRHAGIVKILLREGKPALELADKAGKTALHRAAFNIDTEIVTLLLKAGAKTGTKDAVSYTRASGGVRRVFGGLGEAADGGSPAVGA